MPALAPSSGHEWTKYELAEIGRLRKAYESFEGWQLECSHTDEGDPWCIIYDQLNQRPILHVARIDRRYVVAWPAERVSKWTATIPAAIDVALEWIETKFLAHGF